jgi:hypothetical protein
MATLTVTRGYNNPTGFVSGETVTPAKLNSLGTPIVAITNIVNADIDNAANIALSKLATGALPTAITVASANIVDGSIATADLANNAVDSAKLRDSAALSVIGNSTNASADPVDIAAGTDGHVLRRSGTALGFGKLTGLAFPSNFPIQIVQAVKTDVQTINTGGTDWVDVSGLSITLTRAVASASGKVRIQAVISDSSNNGDHGNAYRIMRDSTAIGLGITEGNRIPTTTMGSYDGQHVIAPSFLDFIDSSPGSSATVTYKIQARIYSTVLGYINRSNNNADAGDYSYRTISTLTLTELAP